MLASPRSYTRALALAFVAAGATPTTSARAESWCALPLDVHEWGVFVIGADGRPAATPPLPTHFHTPASRASGARPTAVRDLPADSGVRALPIVHFYAPSGGFGDTIPIGIEVGFVGADAAAWFPEVDRLRTLADTTSPEALADRLRALTDRGLRLAGARPILPEPPADPTRQLVWDRLELARAAPRGAPTPAATDVPWVARARALGALWVSGVRETERFVFYEARTREASALELRRGPTWTPTLGHYVIENRGRFAAHDVFLVHHEGDRRFVVEVPSIPAGKSASLTLGDHLVPTGDLVSRTRARLLDLLVDQATPEPPTDYRWSQDACVMGRDPAIPFERAEGHRLFRGEAELLLEVWGQRFFEGAGTRIL